LQAAGIILLFAGTLWAFSYYASSTIGGQKPERSYADMPASHPATNTKKEVKVNQEIMAAQAAALEAPESVEAWSSLVTLVQKQIVSEPQSAEPYLSLLVEAMTNLHKLQPENTETIISLADLHFQFRDFEKSEGYYKTALKSRPEDPAILARLASTLSFMQRYDEAIALLQSVLKKEPAHFQARAYLAIALSQKGDFAAAQKEGEMALEHAPSEEAFKRFSGFLEKLQRSASQQNENSNNSTTPPDQAAQSATIDQAAQSSTLTDYLKSNPVAGPKITAIENADGKLRVLLKNFPMSKMPAFAKEKFFNGIRAEHKRLQSSVIEIEFVDEGSNRQMELLSLSTPAP
jgi:tetratricopeptide (TPR) repeat protein